MGVSPIINNSRRNRAILFSRITSLLSIFRGASPTASADQPNLYMTNLISVNMFPAMATLDSFCVLIATLGTSIGLYTVLFAGGFGSYLGSVAVTSSGLLSVSVGITTDRTLMGSVAFLGTGGLRNSVYILMSGLGNLLSVGTTTGAGIDLSPLRNTSSFLGNLGRIAMTLGVLIVSLVAITTSGTLVDGVTLLSAGRGSYSRLIGMSGLGNAFGVATTTGAGERLNALGRTGSGLSHLTSILMGVRGDELVKGSCFCFGAVAADTLGNSGSTLGRLLNGHPIAPCMTDSRNPVPSEASL